MNYCREIAKSYLVLGGIALILVSSLQQSHALCYWLECFEAPVTAVVESTAPSTGCSGCCGRQAKLPGPKPSKSQDSSVPCGPDCICAHAPDQIETQRSATELVDSNSVSIDSAIHASDFAAVAARSASFDLSPCNLLAGDSASDTCVRLCRFLT